MIKKIIKKIIPTGCWPYYHLCLTTLAACFYIFPGKKIKVVGVTGTKGKTSVIEIANAIFEEAGYKTAVISTLRFKIDNDSRANKLKMTMPGRWRLQQELNKAVKVGCQIALVEMTSEGARYFRHAFTYPNVLIVTNISPEHIESHGSYENYLKAKLSIAKSLNRSPKENKLIIVNKNDKEAEKFITQAPNAKPIFFDSHNLKPEIDSNLNLKLIISDQPIITKLPGLFNADNIAAALTLAQAFKIVSSKSLRALSKISLIRGRGEKITPTQEKLKSRQNFNVIVDYAHTANSLEKIYSAFPGKKICVLGGTGGGRDRWKRPVMGQVADNFCQEIILTNEDPYDENPIQIVEEIKSGIKTKPIKIIIDRRQAITEAINKAQAGETVIITGKGTDPYIMEAGGQKTPWDDATVAREELEKRLSK